MHIIVIEPSPSSQQGGQHLSTFEVARYLAHQGHRLSLVYFPTATEAATADLVPQYQEFCAQVIALEEGRFQRAKPWPSALAILRGLLTLQRRLAKPPGAELVYVSSHTHGFFAVLVGLWRRSSKVLHIRTAIGSGLVFHRQDRWAMAQIDRFLAVSEDVKQAWVQEFNLDPQAITPVLNGVDTTKFTPADSPGTIAALRSRLPLPSPSPNDRPPLIITYLGRLHPQKGLGVLLRAFAQLRHSRSDGEAASRGVALGGQDLYLLIAGKPVGFATPREAQTYGSSLRQQVADLGLEPWVRFLGHVDDTVSLYQASDLTVLPSIYPDPCPRSVLESLACGVPIIASRTGGIQETLTAELDPLLCEPDSAEALVAQWHRWLDWRTTDPDLGDRCRRYAQERLSSSATWQRIAAFLQQVAAT